MRSEKATGRREDGKVKGRFGDSEKIQDPYSDLRAFLPSCCFFFSISAV
jgi:hypothetical protein